MIERRAVAPEMNIRSQARRYGSRRIGHLVRLRRIRMHHFKLVRRGPPSLPHFDLPFAYYLLPSAM